MVKYMMFVMMILYGAGGAFAQSTDERKQLDELTDNIEIYRLINQYCDVMSESDFLKVYQPVIDRTTPLIEKYPQYYKKKMLEVDDLRLNISILNPYDRYELCEIFSQIFIAHYKNTRNKNIN